jgi:hypothetical protein
LPHHRSPEGPTVTRALAHEDEGMNPRLSIEVALAKAADIRPAAEKPLVFRKRRARRP